MVMLRVLFILLLSWNVAFAAEKKSSQEKAEEAKNAELRKAIQAKKDEINGSSWSINIKPQGNHKGGLAGDDQLTFQDGKFLSKQADKLGFTRTNYTITVPEGDGPTIFETMQTSKKEGTLFWRGEWKEKAMSGVISHQLEKGNEEYYFTSSQMTEVPETSASEEDSEKTQEDNSTSVAPENSFVSAPTVSGKAETSAAPEKKSSWFIR